MATLRSAGSAYDVREVTVTSGTSRLWPAPAASARRPRSVSASTSSKSGSRPRRAVSRSASQRHDGGGGGGDLGAAEPAGVRGGVAREEQAEPVVAPGEPGAGRQDQPAPVEDQRLGDRHPLVVHGRGQRADDPRRGLGLGTHQHHRVAGAVGDADVHGRGDGRPGRDRDAGDAREQAGQGRGQQVRSAAVAGGDHDHVDVRAARRAASRWCRGCRCPSGARRWSARRRGRSPGRPPS